MEDNRTQCKRGHPFDSDNNYRDAKGRLVCRVCNRNRMRQANSTPDGKAKNVARARAWTDAHRPQYRQYCNERRAKIKAWLDGLKSVGCPCGEKRVECLDFHHVERKNKLFDIGMKWYAVSRKRLEAEVAKCQVICANCHRFVTAVERRAGEM